MDLGLKGLRVLITGGSKGIGRRCADYFAADGAHVAFCARDQKGVDEASAALKAKGVTVFGQAVDVGDKANVSALAVEDNEDAWRQEFEIDMLHTVRTVNAVLPYLEKSKAPSITVISSVSGREIDFTGPAYGAFKAALIHYAHGMAVKLAPKMIRVNSVSPGNVYFEGGVWQYIENNLPDLFKTALSLNPTGRMATPEEVARGVVFLASPASSFTTGTNLVIDGALTKGVQL